MRCETGTATILLEEDGHNTILVYGGANMKLTADDVVKSEQLIAEADFVIVLYNPSSHKRHDYLKKACELMLQHKSPETVCGTVQNINREGETARVMTLAELKETQVDMFTTVFIGNSSTKVVKGRLVTPRGYGERGL